MLRRRTSKPAGRDASVSSLLTWMSPTSGRPCPRPSWPARSRRKATPILEDESASAWAKVDVRLGTHVEALDLERRVVADRGRSGSWATTGWSWPPGRTRSRFPGRIPARRSSPCAVSSTAGAWSTRWRTQAPPSWWARASSAARRRPHSPAAECAPPSSHRSRHPRRRGSANGRVPGSRVAEHGWGAAAHGVKVESVQPSGKVRLDDDSVIEADLVLAARGCHPVPDLPREVRAVDRRRSPRRRRRLRTSDPHVWAAGDVALGHHSWPVVR